MDHVSKFCKTIFSQAEKTNWVALKKKHEEQFFFKLFFGIPLGSPSPKVWVHEPKKAQHFQKFQGSPSKWCPESANE